MHFPYLLHTCTQVNNGGWKHTCPFHGLENKAVKWQWHSPAVEPGQILSSRIARTESSPSPRPWHFGSRLPRHLRSQQVTCYLGLLSGAWIHITWQVLELQVMSNMHGCCYCCGWNWIPSGCRRRRGWAGLGSAGIRLFTELGRK